MMYIIIIFLALILIGIGYLIGKRSHDGIHYRGLPIDEPQEGGTFSLNDPDNGFYGSDNSEIKPGIVYRPTAEELEKFNEPESIRQAKEAVEETIKNTPEPEL